MRMLAVAMNGIPFKTLPDQAWPESFYWWMDFVGSFLTFTKPQVRIGQAGRPGNDIAIMGDISGQHADLIRGDSGVMLVAHSETTVNGKSGDNFLLHNGDRIKMRTVEMLYHQPVPWCSTARLQLISKHRLPLAMDAILLLGSTCVVGPRTDAHIRTNAQGSLIISWYQGRPWVRGPGSLKIDGKDYEGVGPLTPTSEVRSPWGFFRWEPRK